MEVSRRLAALLRPGDTLARLSGDEFVLVLEDLTVPADAGLVAERITQELRRPYLVGSVQLPLTSSIGVAVTAPGEVASPQLVIDADRAMYAAKAAGGDSRHTGERTVPALPQQAVPSRSGAG